MAAYLNNMPETTHHMLVLPHEEGWRLDALVAEKLRGEGLSREKIKKLIKSGKVTVDGQAVISPKFAVMAHSGITVVAETPRTGIEAESGDLAILYRDATLAVINKAAGISVHPSAGESGGTLANILLSHFPELGRQEGFRPGIVHRLDKDTSGLLVVALTEASRLELASEFANREIFKEYLAIVHGVPAQKEGNIEAPIGRHPTHKTRMAVTPGGKPAASSWRVLYADPKKRFSLLAVRIHTGRTHQIRVHMQHMGHPLLGDKVYGVKKEPTSLVRPKRQMLHAWRLAFRHPGEANGPTAEATAVDEQGRLSFLCPPPEDFLACLLEGSRDMLRVVITGSPGSGKSALTALLHSHGFPTFNADAAVAAQYLPGGDGQRLLLRSFGNRFVPHEHAPVDKAALGKAMREDAALRRQVEAMLHPLVWHALRLFWQESEKAGHAAAVAEIPLYLETGRDKSSNEEANTAPMLVGVHCPYAQRAQRVKEHRGWTDETMAAVESWQWPEEKKMTACDIVVNNTSNLTALEDEARLLAKRFDTLLEQRKILMRQNFVRMFTRP